MKKWTMAILCCLPMLVYANDVYEYDEVAAAREYQQQYEKEMQQAEKITGYQFSAYSVPLYRGKKASLDKKDDFIKSFRTRINSAYKEGGISFAGKYILAGWGCGTSCGTGALIDISTGKVYEALTVGEGLIENYGIKPKYICGKLTEMQIADSQQYFKENSRLYIVEETCNQRENADTPQEKKIVIYHVLEWDEKNKKYKWLADKVTRVRTNSQ